MTNSRSTAMQWRVQVRWSLLICLTAVAMAQGADPKKNRSRTLPSRQRDRLLATLPDIRTFRARTSDRFLVNLETVRSGHPYKGKHASRPHTGGHVYFHLPRKKIQKGDVERFPAIYAVADGVISRIDYSFRLREIYISSIDRRVSNTRYGIGLMFAKSAGRAVVMHYSIEPFVDPGDSKFYDRFLLVKIGQRVKKGDIIARMYIPPDRRVAQNAHIHFNLLGGPKRSFQAPAIFNRRIVLRFHSTWDKRRGTDGGMAIPPCMGYRLTPAENPFELKAVDAL